MKLKHKLLANSIALGRFMGLSDREISRRLGYFETYVNAITAHNPEIEKEAQRLTQAMLKTEEALFHNINQAREYLLNQLMALTGDAIKPYEEILKDKHCNPVLRLKAAGEVLDRLGLGRQAKFEISKPEDEALDEDLRRRLKERLNKDLQLY